MSHLSFHPDVGYEIREAYRWYETQAQGLGDDFIEELELAFQAIVEIPETWPKFKKGFRRYILSRFPFAVIYSQINNRLYVIAMMHQSRKPDYWLNRV